MAASTCCRRPFECSSALLSGRQMGLSGDRAHISDSRSANMLSHLKLSAVAVGLLILVATSVVTFFVGATSVSWAVSMDSQPMALVLVLLLFTVHIGGYLGAGYCSAAVAGTQPLLHGAICGLIGAGASIALGSNGLFAFFLGVPAAITGAVLRNRKANAKAANPRA